MLSFLFSDGIREKDKDSLGSILNQIAITKDNSFTLAKHVYADVRPEWPFYTDEDRQILKRLLYCDSDVLKNMDITFSCFLCACTGTGSVLWAVGLCC